ncbi:sirohydrochlorin chelatase [Pontibacillus sp. HMF3514]|uniref:sirohydrochlorin chelatase n=1 Tax=Pontibacillus sp. HMF3514 TaxID=2692425 RepID=UPI0013202D06|nr:sirohydrochlorin chelatase [Pontibacillus sp. HMF3514]QHE51618.1 sirohydrochlorin chelatase [Pontibacillus sp. HMF3514]
MQGVLYVSHGSRVKEATNEAISCIRAAHQHVGTSLWEICFLELTDPTVQQGIERLVQQGSTSITIVPVLLLSAGHYFKDLPHEVEGLKNQYPNVIFRYAKPLGVQDRIIDVLVERIEEVRTQPKTNIDILLVGRGSRYPETKRDIETIAQKLKQKLNGAEIEVSYLAAASPTFEEGLSTTRTKQGAQSIVVPYLWFTGKLIGSMQKKINDLRENNEDILLCDYLNNHPNMVRALSDRVNEVLKNTAEDSSDVSTKKGGGYVEYYPYNG